MMDRTVTHALPMRELRLPQRRSRVVLFFYRRWPQLFMPRRICSWCQALIRRGGIFSRGKVSHGICWKCSEAALHSVRANLPHVQEFGDSGRAIPGSSLPALLFFAAIALSGCERTAPATRDGARDWHLLTIAAWSTERAGAQPGEIVDEPLQASVEVRP